MKHKNTIIFPVMALILALFCAGGIGIAHAQDESPAATEDVKEKTFHTSGLPLPRFVSLGKEKVFVRSGPGDKYPIKWILQRKSLPVEIVLEYDNWRKIKDYEGQEGWVFHSMLSGKRTAIATGEENIPVYETPFEDQAQKTRVIAYLEPYVVSQIIQCNGAWCELDSLGFSGWVERKSLWGVYENENFD